MRIRQSVCLPMLKSCGLPAKTLIAEIARIGYAAVEVWKPEDDFEEIVATAKSHGLALSSFVGHRIKCEVGNLNNRANHDRIEEDLRGAIDLAARHGVPGLIVLSGNRLPHQSSQEAIEVCADCLRRVAPHAEKKGINLNLELLNSKVNHPGYECDHTAWGVAVCQRAGSPRIKLLYDIYHMQIMEGDLIRTIRDNIHYIGHIHTAGNPGRNDLDDDQDLNYAGICRAIAQTGYELYVTHEFAPKADPLAALRRAFEICNVG
jgi:hydroxypyruvate isomerase